jgi:hypothetical protein
MRNLNLLIFTVNNGRYGKYRPWRAERRVVMGLEELCALLYVAVAYITAPKRSNISTSIASASSPVRVNFFPGEKKSQF